MQNWRAIYKGSHSNLLQELGFVRVKPVLLEQFTKVRLNAGRATQHPHMMITEAMW